MIIILLIVVGIGVPIAAYCHIISAKYFLSGQGFTDSMNRLHQKIKELEQGK